MGGGLDWAGNPEETPFFLYMDPPGMFVQGDPSILHPPGGLQGVRVGGISSGGGHGCMTIRSLGLRCIKRPASIQTHLVR